MLTALTYFFSAAIVVSSALSVYFSIRSRRSVDPMQRGLHASKMNISMGLLLICLALVQWFLFEPDTIRIVLGSVFIVLGFFNVFSGLRSFGFYSRISSKPDRQDQAAKLDQSTER
ncbi:YtpI family protein [Paenibacillus thermotolerans]|uniref:YtpI family protein n=1 Tax=Paenibacillus thermotolerans TaxID=3027807 RepID=UPI002367EB19|nr:MULTISPECIES: YtpI family protein [unclassified Paenibacillus]